MFPRIAFWCLATCGNIRIVWCLVSSHYIFLEAIYCFCLSQESRYAMNDAIAMWLEVRKRRVPWRLAAETSKKG